MPKNIVVFCDGTWNSPDQKSKGGKPCPTNVAKLFEAVCPFDAKGTPQIVHYVPGVGTNWRDRITGGGFGYGISDNIKSGYKAICSNYEEGDRIFLFGFSRGAYTARSIAGLIHNMGIIKRTRIYKLNEAYGRYRDKSDDWKPSSPNSQEFRKENCWGECRDIHFLGVWDTVGALGAPYGVVISWIIDKLFKCGFHDTRLSSSIQSACHAVAIDEHRWPFRPTLWVLGDAHARHPADFEERWFPGVHSDVGGGYVESGLSDIVLDWMADKACGRNLCIDLGRVKNRIEPGQAGIKPNAEQPPHDSQTLVYHLATLAFVKIPSALRIPLPGIKREDIACIDWRGDYKRPITPGAPIGYTSTQSTLTNCCKPSDREEFIG